MRRPFPLLAAVLALWASLPAAPAQAQADGLQLVFSRDPKRIADEDKERFDLQLRPNVNQRYYLFVRNSTDKPRETTVEWLAGGEPVANGTAKVMVPAKGQARVIFGKPAPQPGEKQAPPSGEKPAPLPDFAGPLQVRLLDEKGQPLKGGEAEVDIAHPSEYVEVIRREYDPEADRLEITVRARKDFRGPRCRVDLVLRPDRIPPLEEGVRRTGTSGGVLLNPGDEVRMVVENLKFQPGDKNRPQGLVYLTVDGYHRAFIFSATFSATGTVETLTPVGAPLVWLNVPRHTQPSPKVPVGIEVDNSRRRGPAGAADKEADGASARPRLDVGIFRSETKDGKRVDSPDGETSSFIGDRQERIGFNPVGPNGALVFHPTVEDWQLMLDASAVVGSRSLKARLIDPTLEARRKINPNIDDRIPVRTLTPVGRSFLLAPNPVREVVVNLTLDDSRPEGVELTIARELRRGLPLTVKASATDLESRVERAVFFLGKPMADGKPPKDVELVQGKKVQDAKDPKKPTKDTFEATLPLPTDKGGKFEVTVQLTNGAGMTASRTFVVQLVDPPPKAEDAAKGKGATIEGTVTENDRTQPNLSVTLRDNDGKVRDTATTNAEGKYTFKDVAPGTYRVRASKTGAKTTGETTVQVQAGEKKTSVNIRLARP